MLHLHFSVQIGLNIILAIEVTQVHLSFSMGLFLTLPPTVRRLLIVIPNLSSCWEKVFPLLLPLEWCMLKALCFLSSLKVLTSSLRQISWSSLSILFSLLAWDSLSLHSFYSLSSSKNCFKAFLEPSELLLLCLEACLDIF